MKLLLFQTFMYLIILHMFVSQADPRFLWNNYMLEVLIDNKVGLLPVVFMYYVPFYQNTGHICCSLTVASYVQLDQYLLPLIQGSILISLF